MRKLKTSDIFAALRVINKAGVKEDLVPVIRQLSEQEKTIEDVGIIGMLTVIETLSGTKAEQAIYDFLSGPLEMERDRRIVAGGVY